MFHIWMISWEYPPRRVGGLAEHVFYLSKALAKLGENVTVFTLNHHQNAGNFVEDGVNVTRVDIPGPNPVNLVTWVLQLNISIIQAAIEHVAADIWPDLIHVHDWLGAFAGRALKHGLRRPLIATIHATERGRQMGIHTPEQRFINDSEWWLTYEAWRVICCSKFMEGEVISNFQVPSDKVIVIPNGIAPPFELPDEERFAAAGERLICYLGRLVPEKGVDTIIEAAPEVFSSEPRAVFVIAGCGPYETELKAKASRLGLERKVKFVGYIEEAAKQSLLAQSEVAVFPSRYEPFGIVALEAMARGTPVIVSDTGGFKEIVTDGVDGIRVPSGDPKALADSILLVLRNKTLADKLAANGKKTALTKFSWSEIASKTLGVYSDVMKEYRASDWGKSNWGSAYSAVASLAKFIRKER